MSVEGLHLRLAHGWSRFDTASTRGYAFLGDESLTGAALARRVAATPAAELLPLLKQLNGCFALVQTTGDGLLAAVDRVRSIPLFYACSAGRVYLSDDAHWLAKQVPCDAYDELATAEFLLAGLVSGPDTLHPHVKQLQAGELLRVQVTPEGLAATTIRTFHHLPQAYHDRPQAALVAEWDRIFTRACERMLRSVGGRTVVIPLSGGHDSRLIAMTLKRLGYEDVVCFSYGRPDNWQSPISRQVAQRLGYRWEFVPYRLESWRAWFHSEERQAFVRYVDGLASLENYQDWPAVWQLKQRGLVPDDSVFVPGHGASIAGGPVPLALIPGQTADVNAVVRAILKKRYHLWTWQQLQRWRAWSAPAEQLALQVERKVAGVVERMPYQPWHQAASLFQCWDSQEWQAKFINHAVRVYEFWGFDWRLPYWDAEVMAFFVQLPARYLAGKMIQAALVRRLEGDAGLPTRQQGLTHHLKKALSSAEWPPVQRTYRALKALAWQSVYRQQQHNWYGIMSPEQFRTLYSGSQDINSFLALDRLGLVSLGWRK